MQRIKLCALSQFCNLSARGLSAGAWCQPRCRDRTHGVWGRGVLLPGSLVWARGWHPKAEEQAPESPGATPLPGVMSRPALSLCTCGLLREIPRQKPPSPKSGLPRAPP